MGEPKSSWSFVGISQEAREAAEEAAEASGMELDAWLSQLIKYTSAMELRSDMPAADAPEKALERKILEASALLAANEAHEEESSFPGLDPMERPAQAERPRREDVLPVLPDEPVEVPPIEFDTSMAGELPDGTRRVRPDQLQPSTLQALATISEADIQQSVEHMKRGVRQQPVIVRPIEGMRGQFEVVAGIEVWHAARRANRPDLLVKVQALSDEEALKTGLLAQLRRTPLSALREANIYLQLMTDASMTTEQVARLVGKPPAHIATMVRVLNLPKAVRDMLERGEITVLHARALLNAPNPEAIARDVVKRRLDIYQTEQLVRISSRNIDTVEAASLIDDDDFDVVATPPPAASGNVASSQKRAPIIRTSPATVVASRPTVLDTTYTGSAAYGDFAPEEPDYMPQPEARPPAHRAEPATPPRAPAAPVGADRALGELANALASGTDNEATTELLERHLARLLDMKVSITERNEVGAITLHYTSREQLSELIGRLNGGGKYG